MYQCFVTNEWEQIQSTAELQLGGKSIFPRHFIPVYTTWLLHHASHTLHLKDQKKKPFSFDGSKLSKPLHNFALNISWHAWTEIVCHTS